MIYRSPEQVTERLDKLIAQIKTRFKRSAADGDAATRACDVVCVAHGHILSAFALRWAEQPLKNAPRLLIDTAGVGVLR